MPNRARPHSGNESGTKDSVQTNPAGDSRTARDHLFIEHLETIRRIGGSLCRSRGLQEADVEDFLSWSTVRLLSDDARRLRAFRGRGSLNGYLRTVIRNLLRDYLDSVRGKWRPSARARRLGPTGVELDRLMNRDGCSVSEAVSSVLDAADRREAPEAITDLARQIPLRGRPTVVPLSQGESVASTDLTPEDTLLRLEAAAEERELMEGLRRALRGLPETDRRILYMRYWEGSRLSDIARHLGLPAKPLYRRMARIHAALRRDMETQRRETARTLRGPNAPKPGSRGGRPTVGGPPPASPVYRESRGFRRTRLTGGLAFGPPPRQRLGDPVGPGRGTVQERP